MYLILLTTLLPIMSRVILGLGSNLGNRKENLRRAIDITAVKIGEVLDESPVYETEPWGFKANNQFLNMVIEVETSLNPDEVIKRIFVIEEQLGRVRKSKQYISRTIDIDILFYDNLILNNESLDIPHPSLHERKFVLAPLNDITPGFIHPVLKVSVSELLSLCTDNSLVKRVP